MLHNSENRQAKNRVFFQKRNIHFEFFLEILQNTIEKGHLCWYKNVYEIINHFADCFEDHRDKDLIEPSVLDLVGQRVYGLALGYEDLNDHDELRSDPLLATLVGKSDPAGEDRLRERDKGKPLAGKSTLNRLELTPENGNAKNRYKKIVANDGKINQFFVDVFVRLTGSAPERIVLDLDATDDPLHGNQEGRFFHGYYSGAARRSKRNV